MNIITIANNKGGVAKTTTTYNLGKCLALHNKKVLLIDLDPQGNLTEIAGIDKDNLTQKETIASIFIDKTSNINNLILQVNDIDIIPCNLSLQQASELLQTQPNNEYRLSIKIKDITGYDYILIDTPPSTNIITRNGLIASDNIIIPIQAEQIAIQGMADLLKFIDDININLKEMDKPQINIMGILITMVDNRTALNKLIKNSIIENMTEAGINIFNTYINRNVRIAEAPIMRKSIFEYDKNSQGAKDYEALTLEIIGGIYNDK